MPPDPLPPALAAAHADLQARRLSEADVAFRAVLQLAPDHPEAVHFLGLTHFHRGQPKEAIDLLRRSVQLAPDQPQYWANLGVALQAVGGYQDAAACQQRALALQPDFPGASGHLGDSLRALGRAEEAVECYRRELAARPGNGGAWNNLGLALWDLGRTDAAADAYRRALSVRADDANAWNNLGTALSETGQVAEGLAAYRRAAELRPDDPTIHSNVLLAVQYDPAQTVATIRAENERWAARHAAPLAAEAARPHANDRTPGRRVRIGYVSPDLRAHVVGLCIEPVLARHDRGRFEVVCYSDTPRPDAVTARLRANVDLWRQTGGLSDAALAEQIRADRIDVLVDLAQHSAFNRLSVFARKPAPVQIAYLGYPASTGLPTVDYRVTDPYLDPPGAGETLADGFEQSADGPERLLRLPACYWAYRPAVADGRDVDDPALNAEFAPGPLPLARNGVVTFGAFNNMRKANPAVLAAWAGVLRAVPGSRLVFVLRGAEASAHLPAAFAAAGIDPRRIVLVPRQTVPGYFRLHTEVDVVLETFPYPGGISTLNALWMGVPFVTLAGQLAAGRAGTSALNNVGLSDLVATDLADYVRRTAALAADADRLADLRRTLRARLRASPFMDEERFTRDFEALYQLAWERW